MDALSDDWLAAMRDAAAGARVDPDVELTIDYCAGPRAYRLTISGGRVTVTPDPDGDAEIRISATAAAAREIQDGRRAALAGFMTGEVVVGGDLAKLMAHQDALAALGSAFAAVRDAAD